MCLRVILLATILAASLLPACAPRQQLKPVADQSDRQEYLGLLTFVPPQGKNWFEVQHRDGLIIYKKNLGRNSRSFTASVRVSRTDRTYPDVYAYLVAARAARTAEVEASHAEVLLHEETIDTGHDAVCTQFHMRTANRTAPTAGEGRMLQETKGYSCVHPTESSFLITIQYSDRHTATFGDPALLAEGEQFIHSLRLKR